MCHLKKTEVNFFLIQQDYKWASFRGIQGLQNELSISLGAACTESPSTTHRMAISLTVHLFSLIPTAYHDIPTYLWFIEKRFDMYMS
jgi:hypothetical protein